MRRSPFRPVDSEGDEMRGARRMRAVAGLFAVALLVGACGGDDEGDGDGGATGGGGEATITIADFTYDPATLQVSGETTVTITNDDTAAHTFTLDDGSVDQEVGAGESAEVTVNVSETTGFHCEFHPDMTGTIEVA
jgi:plastocyanin